MSLWSLPREIVAAARAVARDARRLGSALTSLEDLVRLVEHIAWQQIQSNHSQRETNSSDAGFRLFSQNEEDGLLLQLISLVGAQSRFLVDIGARAVRGSNSANLLINHGWSGLLIDADQESTIRLRQFYERHPDTRSLPPVVVHQTVTSSNIGEILDSHCARNDVDLLSIDVDGVDYWICRAALERIRPRIIVVEAQVIWDHKSRVTVPDDPKFVPIYRDGFAIYSGASVSAWHSLAADNDYQLVAHNRLGYNLFFVQNELCHKPLRPLLPEDITALPFPKMARERYLASIIDLLWVEV